MKIEDKDIKDQRDGRDGRDGRDDCATSYGEFENEKAGKYLLWMHLAYAAFFTLSANTVPSLGNGPGFPILLDTVLIIWLLSAACLIFRMPWAWFCSLICVFLLLLLLMANLAAAIAMQPRYSDYALDIALLLALYILPLTLVLYGLCKTRTEVRIHAWR